MDTFILHPNNSHICAFVTIRSVFSSSVIDSDHFEFRVRNVLEAKRLSLKFVLDPKMAQNATLVNSLGQCAPFLHLHFVSFGISLQSPNSANHMVYLCFKSIKLRVHFATDILQC